MFHSWIDIGVREKRKADESGEQQPMRKGTEFLPLSDDRKVFVHAGTLFAAGFVPQTEIPRVYEGNRYFVLKKSDDPSNQTYTAKIGISEYESKMSIIAAANSIGPEILVQTRLPIFDLQADQETVVARQCFSTRPDGRVIENHWYMNCIVYPSFENRFSPFQIFTTKSVDYIESFIALYEKQIRYGFVHGNINKDTLSFRETANGPVAYLSDFSMSIVVAIPDLSTKLVALDWIVPIKDIIERSNAMILSTLSSIQAKDQSYSNISYYRFWRRLIGEYLNSHGNTFFFPGRNGATLRYPFPSQTVLSRISIPTNPEDLEDSNYESDSQ